MKALPRNIADWEKWLELETLGDAALVSMANTCADWVLALKHNQAPRWITLLGKSGTGKTHCATRLWRLGKNSLSFNRTGFVAQKIYWPSFIAELRGGTAFEHLQDLMIWPVLMLDDIGAERDTTGFASEQLNMLLGRREGKWTILTSNLSLENLGQIDPRIADRIIRKPNLFVEVDTKSYSLRESQLPYKD